MIKVGVIGLGVGEEHVDTVMQNAAFTVKAACDLIPEKCAKLNARFPSIQTNNNAEAILDDPEISVVVIASNDNYHHAQALRAIANGKHIFVEKPLCLRPEHAEEIRNALRKNPQLSFSSNLILRRSPRFQSIKEMIVNGTLGTVYSIEGAYNFGRLKRILDGWRGSIDDYSPILGGGIHLVDLMLWYAQARVREVMAVNGKLVTADSSYRYPDLVTALLSFEGGVVGHVAADIGCVYPHFHRFSVYGTKATFENGFDGGKLFTKRDAFNSETTRESSLATNTLQSSSAAEPFALIRTPYPGVHKGALLAEFLGALVGREVTHPTVDEIFDGLSVCFAIQESARTGKSIQVRYI